MHMLVLTTVNLHTKFEGPSFPFPYVKWGFLFKNGSCDPDQRPWPYRVVCHPEVNTWYRLPMYKI